VTLRIDAHQHFWRVARGDYGWLTPKDTPGLYRDYGPADLAPLLAAGRIDRTILVQAAETIAETRHLLDIAAITPFVAGVVGWVDFEARDAAAQILALAEDRKLKGLRPMQQDMEDKTWMLRPSLAPALAALQHAGLAFDALIKPPHLPHLPAFVARYPDLRIVIDHAAKPYIAHGEIEPWLQRMRAVAAHPNVFCKFSGLATEAGDWWSAAKLKPYADALFDCFTPGRLMWGSDWPVLTLASDYASWLNAAEHLTSGLSLDECAAIFGGTAAAFYGL